MSIKPEDLSKLEAALETVMASPDALEMLDKLVSLGHAKHDARDRIETIACAALVTTGTKASRELILAPLLSALLEVELTRPVGGWPDEDESGWSELHQGPITERVMLEHRLREASRFVLVEPERGVELAQRAVSFGSKSAIGSRTPAQPIRTPVLWSAGFLCECGGRIEVKDETHWRATGVECNTCTKTYTVERRRDPSPTTGASS